MTLWLLIAFSALTAFAFRALPFAFKNSAALTQTQGSFYRFISYSAQADRKSTRLSSSHT